MFMFCLPVRPHKQTRTHLRFIVADVNFVGGGGEVGSGRGSGGGRFGGGGGGGGGRLCLLLGERLGHPEGMSGAGGTLWGSLRKRQGEILRGQTKQQGGIEDRQGARGKAINNLKKK